MRSTSRLRLVYFSLAALWGFVIGAGALAAAAATSGLPLDLDPISVAILLPGALLAVIGGAVAAAAYREARRRLR